MVVCVITFLIVSHSKPLCSRDSYHALKNLHRKSVRADTKAYTLLPCARTYVGISGHKRVADKRLSFNPASGEPQSRMDFPLSLGSYAVSDIFEIRNQVSCTLEDDINTVTDTRWVNLIMV